jgi:2,3-bisphosphoglycerate-dependent phosphoglycerate mutase
LDTSVAQLNEQMYGMLTGLNKFDTIQKYGYEQVQKWRRSYEEAPPAMKDRVGYFPPNDRKYLSLGDADVPDSWCGSPGTESLKDTQARAWSLWKKEVGLL